MLRLRQDLNFSNENDILIFDIKFYIYLKEIVRLLSYFYCFIYVLCHFDRVLIFNRVIANLYFIDNDNICTFLFTIFYILFF